METILNAYYHLIDDSKDYPEWQRKFEDEIGSSIHYMTLTLDEAIHDDLVERSELFRRFVSHASAKTVCRITRSRDSSSELDKLVAINRMS
jgi:hypothetical protein